MSYTSPGTPTAATGTWLPPGVGTGSVSAGLIAASTIPLVPGCWGILGNSGILGSYQAPNNFIFVLPFTPITSGHIDQIAVNVAAAATAGGTSRFGLYQGNNPILQGLAILQDYGAAACTATGLILSPISSNPVPVIAGQTYWAGVVTQGNPATPASYLGVQGWNQALAVVPGAVNAPSNNSGSAGLYTSGITGLLNAPLINLAGNSAGPVIQVHMAP